MRRKFVVTNTVRQNEILALVDSWVTDAPSVGGGGEGGNASPYIRKNKTCSNVDLIRICQGFSLLVKLCARELRHVAVS